ncbi:MAG: N-acetyl-gamma-glutamyl-phosphate reductase [Desulfobacterales bacterium]|nr:N-acetyl-gamma-glutamyl-phosphate reductase [Desulfobacterales bacterium]
MIRVGVVGATGYAGAELVRILAGHPGVELRLLTSRQHAGAAFSDIYPAMAGIVDIPCEAYNADAVADRTDVVFFALPHQLPMGLVPELMDRGRRIVDLSADFRFQNADVYERHYQPHTARELLPQAVYGLSEVYRDRIRKADLIGNPGCYPTSVLLPLIPLIREGLLEPRSLIADAKSGVSGAGRSPARATLFCEVAESFKPYKVGAHRHTPEMEEVLTREAGDSIRLTFVPHLVPMSRGMLTTLYGQTKKGVDEAAVKNCLARFYPDSPFVRICPKGRPPDTRNVRGTNYCDIGFYLERGTGRLILMSAIDNLVKGAAGQAVQNMNLMLGLAETEGLTAIPAPL